MDLRLEKLTKRFGDVLAVDSLDLYIPEGDMVGLLGPSGCGKSTTLYMIAGLYRPDGGRIYFGEDDVTDQPPEERHIGLVFQNYALYPHMTVRKNILFPLENSKVPKAEAEEIVKEMAALVQISDLLDRRPAQLSGGQQQRVAIARALAKKPNILLLDEPLSNLDARLRLETREEIKRIQSRTGVTTVYVTHDQEEAMSITDTIVLMKDGLKQQEDEPQRIYDNPANLFAARFLGNPPLNVLHADVQNGQLLIGGHRFAESAGYQDGPVIAGIRAEGWIIGDEGVECELLMSEHIGREAILTADLEGNTIRILADPSQNWKSGSLIRLGVNPDALFLFHPETEARMFPGLADERAASEVSTASGTGLSGDSA